MTSKQRCSLRRKLRKQGKSEEEIQAIINTTTAKQGEAQSKLTSGLSRKERRHVEKRHKRNNK
ncbi:hypothetical protein [Photobacterium leiognathi]|uniref:hypothetical protein n=1 Tax=Photobacterium leiognathi TaxID=553611 RepID=UPI002980AC4F|nr:hypothetical protein [Photobacterium leiognathi]